jgi:hypothetical protein
MTTHWLLRAIFCFSAIGEIGSIVRVAQNERLWKLT